MLGHSLRQKAKKRTRFYRWLNTPLGHAFLHAESACLHPVFKQTVYRDSLLVMGAQKFCLGMQTIPYRHKIWVTHQQEHSLLASSVVMDEVQLGIMSDTQSTVYLPHVLAWTANPHEVLRESYRVLVPEGDLLVTGINPYSLWGLWGFVRSWPHPPAWKGDWHPYQKLIDWVNLLGFDVMQCQTFFFLPPTVYSPVVNQLAWLEKLGSKCWPGFGAGYIIWAKKRTIPLNPAYCSAWDNLLGSEVEPGAAI